jgi:hypothetical protein
LALSNPLAEGENTGFDADFVQARPSLEVA